MAPTNTSTNWLLNMFSGTPGASSVASAVKSFINYDPNATISTGLAGKKKTTVATPATPATPKPLAPATSSIPTSAAPSLLATTAKTLPIPAAQQTGNDAADKAFNDLLGQMSSVASSQLKGAISASVEAQIRQKSAESGLSYGLGANSVANRSLTARDLGLTSLQIQQQGQTAAAAVTSMIQQRQQFNTTAQIQYAAYLEDVRKGDLSAIDLQERSRQFNASQRLAAMELLASTQAAYQGIQYSYSALSKPTAGQTATAASAAADSQSLFDAQQAQFNVGSY